MTCYLCGRVTSPDHSFRRDVGTGTGYTGWRVTESRVANSLFFGGRWSRAPRSYYGLRTVCGQCARQIDEQNRRKSHRMWFLIPFILLFKFIMAILATLARGKY